jgi:integrase/recombinase XerC
MATSATLPATQQVIPRSLRWRMKLSSAITAFIAEIRINRSRLTVAGYESHLRRLAAKAQVDTVLRFTAELVKLELEMASAAGAKMSTLHVKRACFNTFGRWGVKNKLWPVNPVEHLEPIGRPKHVPRPFSADDIARLRALRLPEDQALLMQIFFLTGLRVTPVCSLKVGDVSFAPAQIRAWVKGAKTQVVQLHPALVGPLQDYITKRTDGKSQTFLFQNRLGGPMHRRTVERMTGIWGRKAQVVNCIPHRFRHSFGTELLRKTNDIKAVQEALGHADIGSTMGYAALADDRLAKAIGTLAWGDQ